MILLSGLHRPRVIGSLGVHEVAGWQVKVYGIAWKGERPRPSLVEAGIHRAGQALPAPAWRREDEGPDRYGVGFCVVHDAGDRCFVLVDWWAAENELHQRMFSAPLEEPDALVPHASEAIGCVWELEVVDFERRAWLRHVLANPGGPDLDAYLHATFTGKV
ncbi:hypothetical protein [Actinomadura sp. 6N118]|uniref:hypothetical protein n=1 Tax=Actinomadura sp. 6N118 TaxID=3375151 RepID=UPI0037B2F6C7